MLLNHKSLSSGIARAGHGRLAARLLLALGVLGLVACTGGSRRGGTDDATAGGNTGFQNVDGNDGSTGADGSTSTDGSTGTSGTSATEGTDGTEGDDGTAGEDGSDGSTGVTGTTGVELDGVPGFPSEELFLQIMGPGSADHVATGSAVTYVAGSLFGKAERITWSTSAGQSGEAKGDSFWQSGPITLSQGDNDIVVRAVGPDDEVSEDRIRVTYNPAFHFADRPTVRPASFFTGSEVNVVVNIGIRTQNFLKNTVTLMEVDKDGATLGQLGTMVDSGDTSTPNCDEIQDDGVYSRCIGLSSQTPTTRYLRVSLQVTVAGSLVTVFTPIIPIEIVDPLSQSDCEAMHQVQKDALALYQTEVQGGNANPSAAVVAMLKAAPNVVDAGTNSDGHGIWTQFSSGVMGALNTAPAGTRGGEPDDDFATIEAAIGNEISIQSKRVLALAPFNSEFADLDEVPELAGLLNAQQCPEFRIDGPYNNGGATLARFRQSADYGIVLYSGHTDAYFTTMDPAVKASFAWEHNGSQEILWTGEAVSCADLSATMGTCTDSSDCPGDSECVITQASGTTTSGVCVDHTQIDLRRGRLVMGAKTWGIHPQFFPRHAKRAWPDSLVYLGSCRSLYNGTLAAALFGVGAKAVAGFTDYVSSTFAHDQAVDWFSKMLSTTEATGTATLFPHADPDNPSGQFGLFGARNLVITDSEILNPGFESGETTGWNVDGDGRVIGQLGISLPVGGKFMGILSTGLGYTQTTGELNQDFCIPAGATTMSFYWKFFSEEFTEWCGDIYQDTFQATLETDSGQLSLVDVRVDDLCDSSDCFGCGAKYVGLIASDVSFDQGGVYNTQWQLQQTNIAAVAGAGPVTLRLFATDTGDSIYDTAILVDSITFE